MKLSQIGELSLIEIIRERFGYHSGDVLTGIGDDTAVIKPRRENLLLTTDTMTEGIHFVRRLVTPYQLGFKLTSVNASDIFAMGGSPAFMLLALSFGKDISRKFMDAFFNGLQDAMDLYNIKLIGGNLSSSVSGMVMSATMAGYARTPVMRSGARPGDKIYVTGSLGDSACGLELLRLMKKPLSMEKGERVDKPLKWAIMKPLLRRHLMPVARDPHVFCRHATSMIDISDGLFIDLARLCDASGTGARIYLKDIPVSPQMKKAASVIGIDPYKLATAGGEDYELLFTASPRKKIDAICIGEITASGKTVVDGKKEKSFSAEGYRHWH